MKPDLSIRLARFAREWVKERDEARHELGMYFDETGTLTAKADRAHARIGRGER